MQLLFKLTALMASMTATTTALVALDPRATVPSIDLISYPLQFCTKSNAAGAVTPKQTTVNRDNCTALPLTLSFENTILNPCPAGTSPEVTVYNQPACNGQGTVSRSFDGTCVNPVVTGQSAFFKCNLP